MAYWGDVTFFIDAEPTGYRIYFDPKVKTAIVKATFQEALDFLQDLNLTPEMANEHDEVIEEMMNHCGNQTFMAYTLPILIE